MAKVLRFVLIALLFACDSTRVFEEFHSLNQWAENDSQSFDFSVEDDKQAYNLVAQFKYDMAFSYQNFYFQVKLEDERDSVLLDELHEVIFFEPKTGRPEGDGVGSAFDISHPIQTAFVFPNKGAYSISYQQYMRVDTLSDILKTGFRLEKNIQ